MTQSTLKDYTYTGSFQLHSGNTVLGDVFYAENISNHYKIYRISDFIRALHLPNRFTNSIESRHRFPGTRHCWAPWITIKSALNNLSSTSTVIEDIANRNTPEECTVPVKFEKKNKILDFLLRLPNEKLFLALNTFHVASSNFGAWVKQFNEKPENFSFKDLEEFSALDFMDLLHSYKFKIVTEIEENKPENEEAPAVQVKTFENDELDGKNLQVVFNIKLS